MKKILFLVLGAAMMVACKQEEIERFDDSNAMVSFRSGRAGVSFQGVEGTQVTGEIKFDVVGSAVDYERDAIGSIRRVRVTNPETLEAYPQVQDENFEILEAKVPAGATQGVLKFRVTKPWATIDEETSDLYVIVDMVDGDVFKAGPVSAERGQTYTQTVLVTVSPRLTRPASWTTYNNDNSGLGFFSPAYYKWLIDVTGLTEFPFQVVVEGMNLDSNGKPQVWPTAQRTAFLNMLKIELIEYNLAQEAAGKPRLTHDYGVAKGQEVVISKTSYVEVVNPE